MLKNLSPTKIIVILGPTASGKSELAVKLAKKFNGEIISADSRQVYKGLNIGAGKVPRDEISNFQFLISKQRYFYKGIEHHLLDVVSPKRTFTVAQYQKLAKKALKEIIKRGKIPIICGGTGLYVDALIYDYQFPAIAPQPKLRKQLEKKSAEELFKQLKKLDPRRARNIDKNNRRRLIRALEIILTTHKPVPSLVVLRKRSSTKDSKYNFLKIGIKKSPEELKKPIKLRLLRRLKRGMIKEVKNLRENGFYWQRLDNLGLEYRYVSRYLRNLISKQKMIDSILKESYRYAKRQMTWFKKDKRIIWVKNYQETEKLTKKFLH